MWLWLFLFGVLHITAAVVGWVILSTPFLAYLIGIGMGVWISRPSPMGSFQRKEADRIIKVVEKRFHTLDDGIYYYEGTSAWALRVIADHLDKINAEWHRQVERGLRKSPPWMFVILKNKCELSIDT